MAWYIKNNTEDCNYYQGYCVGSGEYRQIPATAILDCQVSWKLYKDVQSGDAVICTAPNVAGELLIAAANTTFFIYGEP